MVYANLSMLGLNLNNVSKRAPIVATIANRVIV